MRPLEEKILLMAENYMEHARMKELCEEVLDGIADKASELYDYYLEKVAYCEVELRYCSEFFRDTRAGDYISKTIGIDEFMGRLDDAAYSRQGMLKARKGFDLWLSETD